MMPRGRWTLGLAAGCLGFAALIPVSALESPPSPPSTAAAPGVDPSNPQSSATLDQDLRELNAALRSESDGGKNGITPQMAEQIARYLNEKQGGSSPDMRNLLEAVQKDGVNLSAETMRKLRRAAREAKQSGLDLNVSSDVEKELLSGEEDAPSGNEEIPKIENGTPGTD